MFLTDSAIYFSTLSEISQNNFVFYFYPAQIQLFEAEMKLINTFFLLVAMVLLFSCSSGGGDNEVPREDPPNQNQDPPSGGGGSVAVPNATTQLVVTPGGNQCILNWRVVDDAEKYNIYWSESSGVTTDSTSFAVSEKLNYQHTKRTNGVTYYYAIESENAAGKSELSEEMSCTPEAIKIVDIIAGSGVSAGIDEIGRVWSWGYSSLGSRSVPAPVCIGDEEFNCSDFLTDILKIQSGGSKFVALKSDGTVWTWGGYYGNSFPVSPQQICAPGQVVPCESYLENIVSIAAGSEHYLALSGDGFVYAWGRNWYGEIGDATSIEKTIPVQVCASGETSPCENFLSNIEAISASGHHNLALDSNKLIWAWGMNNSGQLGAPTSELCTNSVKCSNTPLQVQGLTNVSKIAAGYSQSYAVKTDGTLWGWGSDHHGALGTGSALNENETPARICAVGETFQCTSYLTNIVSVVAGYRHALALHANGSVFSWGENPDGVLGNGTSDYWLVSQVLNLTGIVEIAAGSDHSLSLDINGKVNSWGSNSLGQLGVERILYSKYPRKVESLENVTSIAVSAHAITAGKADGSVWSWGNDMRRHRGFGAQKVESTPIPVIGIPSIKSVTAAGAGFYSLTSENEVWHWGNQALYENQWEVEHVCDSGETIPCLNYFTDVLSIGRGKSPRFTTAIRSDNTLWSWGENSNGSLGDGTTTNSTMPIQVCAPDTVAPCSNFFDHVVQAANGINHALALRDDGTVWAWGGNYYGQLGVGNNLSNPLPAQVCATGESMPCDNYLEEIVSIAAGDYFSVAVDVDGGVWTWGNNYKNMLGDGTSISHSTPVKVCAPGDVAPCASFLTGIVSIAAGSEHVAGIDVNGEVWAWGANQTYQLGDGTNEQRSVPVQVCDTNQSVSCETYIKNAVSISAGYNNTAIIKNDGTVWIWGSNGYGQLGDGATVMRLLAGSVDGL